MADTKTFNQIKNTVGQIGGIAGNLGKVGATWAGAYLNVPQAQSNGAYMAKAAQVGNTRYGASDMAGLMSQWRNTPTLKVLKGKDLYNPSSGELFGSMFGAGMASYGAMSDLTSSVKNFVNGLPEQAPQEAASSPSDNNPNNFTAEDLATAQSNEEKYDMAEQMTPSALEKGIYKDMSIAAGGGNSTPEMVQPVTGQEWMNQGFDGPTDFGYGATFGGQHSLGGKLYAGGGGLDVGFDWGNAATTAVNIASGGIGVALNYAGIMSQKRAAEQAAQEYNATRLYANQLNEHNFNNAVTDTKNNMFNMQALQMMAQGGELQTQGTEFPLNGNFNLVGAGGTHEINPMGGVQQGIGQNGEPNLVEEGEVIWNDYVFSDSRREDKKHKKNPLPDLRLPEALIGKYKSLNENMTFAQAAQKLAEEAKERPNDPISQLGLQTFMEELKATQEQVKQEKEAKELKKVINKMSPEELIQLQQMLQQGQQVEQQQQMPQQQMQQMPPEMQQPMPEMQQQPMFAMGGNLFAGTDATASPSQGKFESDNIFVINGKRYKVDSSFANDYRSGAIHVSVDANGNIVAKKAPQGYKYSEQGPMVKVASGSGSGTRVVSEGTEGGESTYQDVYTNKGNFMENDGTTVNIHRMDTSKTKEQVRQREAEDLYERTNQYIREQLADYVSGKVSDLSGIDSKLLAKLKEVDTQYTSRAPRWFLNKTNPATGKKYTEADWDPFTDPNKLFNRDGILRKDVLEVLLDKKDAKGNLIGLRTDGKEGPNHWSAEWLDTPPTPPEEEPYEWSFEEWKPTEREKDEIYEEEKEIPPLPTWMRYAPVVGAAIGALPQNPKDYSTMVAPRTAHYEPIGDYLEYNPVDTQRYLNAENQQAAAQRNAIMNASGANKNMAMAQMALANRQRQQGMADILNTAEAMNFARKAQVGEFNRGTNMFNAQAHNATEQANLAVNNMLLNQDQTNQRMRYMVDKDIDTARSASMNALLTSLGNIGKENFYMNQINSNKALYYGVDGNPLAGGQSFYRTPGNKIVVEPTAEDDSAVAVGALGGRLLTKTNKRNRRK